MGESPIPTSFVRDLAHDFLNPLSSILGFLDLLVSPEAKDPLTHRQRRMLAAMTRSSTHLLGMMRDLMELSKVEGAPVQPAPVPVDLGKTARTIFGHYRLLADLRRITMSVEAAADLPPAWADPHWTEVFFDTLVRAAGRRTHEGGHIILHLDRDPSGLVGRLEHTGDLVFAGADEPALSGTLAAPRPMEGYAALGMALLRRIARLQGGDLDVLPRAGGGVVFRFRLPAAP